MIVTVKSAPAIYLWVGGCFASNTGQKPDQEEIKTYKQKRHDIENNFTLIWALIWLLALPAPTFTCHYTPPYAAFEKPSINFKYNLNAKI